MFHRRIRARELSALALFSALLTPFARAQTSPKPVPYFALQHVTVIDGTGADPKLDMTIVVQDGAIRALGKSSDIVPPAEAFTVDARGKYVIPGLWDMHVHCDNPRLTKIEASVSDRKAVLGAFPASGVIGVRDMGGEFRVLPEWRDEIEAGNNFGPRIVLCGPVVDGERSPIPQALVCTNAAQVAHVLSKLKGRGSDFVSIESGLSRDAYLALAAEAKKQGLPFAGCVSDALSNVEASDAGQASLEALAGMVRDCGDVDAARAKVRAADPETSPKDLAATFKETLLATQSPDKERAMIAHLAKNKTWVTPMLVALRREAFFDEDRAQLTDEFAHVSGFLREASDEDTHPKLIDRTEKSIEVDRAMFDRCVALVGALHKGGVRLLAGTDACEAPLCLPGSALQGELALLVRAGLSPADALRTATKNPAEYLGLADKVGTIEVGKLAEFVVLTADPLADIQNVSKIDSVAVRGRLYSKPLLDRLGSRGQVRAAVSTDK